MQFASEKTSCWRKENKSTEEQAANMSKCKRGEYFRDREDNEKGANLEMESQDNKYKLCSRVT